MSDIHEEVKDLSIRQFKLMNGDEIIGLIVSNNESNYTIDRPFKIEIDQYKSDAYQLVPWFDLSLSNTFTIDKSMVVAHANVADRVKETYIKFAISLDNKLTPSQTESVEESESDDLPDLIPSNKSDIVH